MKMPDLRTVEKVLIIRLSSIGDVVHALPVASALKRAHPHLRLTWIVEEMSAAMVQHSPCLDEVIVLPRERWKRGRLYNPRVWAEYLRLVRNLRARRFDLCLDLQGYAKSGLLAMATDAPFRFGWHRLRDVARLASRPAPRRPESVHRVEQFLDVARMLGVAAEPVEFPLGIPEPARARARELLLREDLQDGQPFALVNPAAGSATKRWPPEWFAEVVAALANQAHLRSVLVGIRRDAPLCEEVAARACRLIAEPSKHPANLAARTSLLELAAILERSALHVSGDTGSAHIAAALGIPVVGVYGPTRADIHGPWGPRSHVVGPAEPCPSACSERRCVRLGGRRAAEATPAHCLRQIAPERVIGAALAACAEALHR